jgi:hypothetical protein
LAYHFYYWKYEERKSYPFQLGFSESETQEGLKLKEKKRPLKPFAASMPLPWTSSSPLEVGEKNGRERVGFIHCVIRESEMNG